MTNHPINVTFNITRLARKTENLPGKDYLTNYTPPTNLDPNAITLGYLDGLHQGATSFHNLVILLTLALLTRIIAGQIAKHYPMDKTIIETNEKSRNWTIEDLVGTMDGFFVAVVAAVTVLMLAAIHLETILPFMTV